jgi:mercuric reductase
MSPTPSAPSSPSRTSRIRVSGMTCEHCVRTVETSLRALEGVRARVSLDDEEALVEHPSSVPPERLLEAIRAKGYGAEILPADETPRRTQAKAGDLHVVILGSGSAAFACALRAAREGARVTMVEEGTLGGTCVNVGCVPSKILVRAAAVAHTMERHPFAGITHAKPSVDRALLFRQLDGRVEELHGAKYERVAASEPGIRILHGRGRFRTATEIEVEPASGGTTLPLEADRVLVATGARPAVPSIPGLRGTPFWTSTEALAATETPERLVVLGGSAVGLEIAQAFHRLGSDVTVIERESRLLPREDEDLGLGLEAVLVREGLRVLTRTETLEIVHDGATFRLRTSAGPLAAERLLVAVGRRPATDGLGLEAIGVKRAPNGAVVVDDRLRTSVPNVYAAGDCTTLPQFVYVSAASGTRAAANMLGHDEALDLATVPFVVFTDPEAAGVGLGEEEARARGYDPESRTLPLSEVPRALVGFETDGFVRLVADRGTGRLLGARILAPQAGEIVTAAALALRAGFTVDELGAMLFPYLVASEGLKLCAQTFRLDVHKLSCCAG